MDDRFKQLRKQEKEFVELVLGDKTNSRLFRAKINECQLQMLELKAWMDRVYTRMHSSNPPPKWYDEMIIERIDKYKKKLAIETRRFEWYWKKCLGKSVGDGLDIEGAKRVLISAVLGVECQHKTNRRRFYLCPLHNEKTPSFVWFKEDNKFHCFGCTEHGDVIDLFQKMHNCSFKEAVTELSKY